jgi:cation diffusion facilitator CzcD-associated flavoprotein CzcO
MPENNLVAIIGAGFAGIGLGAQLKKRGFRDFVILEGGDDIGGVWRDNAYPGCACDIPAVLYSYSFETGYPWTKAYPSHEEILAYIRWVSKKYELQDHIVLNTKVVDARFDEALRSWQLRTEDDRQFDCAFFVSAVGIFNEPSVPQIAGLTDFEGDVIHSARWRNDVPLSGKRLAVIGTGASAIQIVPELAEIAEQLVVFQRTPPYVVPKAHTTMQFENIDLDRARILAEFENAARRRADLDATQADQDRFMQYLAEQVPDPELRGKLTPPFPLGCKRTLFSNNWYQALQRANVIVESAGIDRVFADSILCADGQSHVVDAIIFATGFNPSNYLPGLSVSGRSGVSLHEVWHEGAEAYLGICVSDFPNMFLMYGPNTNISGSILYMLECQAQFILQAIEAVTERRADTIEVSGDAYRRYCDEVQLRLTKTAMSSSLCTSYFMNESGRVVTNFPGTCGEYQAITSQLKDADFLFAG